MQYFRVSILAGVVVTVPVAFYHIYAFAKPGLKKSESTFFKLVMLLGLILFCVGVLFAYKLMMPFMLRFLSTGIEGAEYIQTTTSIESYVNLCLTMFIIFGCVFEMPLITIILSKMGIINPTLLKQVRGVAIVIIFFIAAVVTPPDIVSQCMVAGPMVLLYFISIFLSGIFYKPKSDVMMRTKKRTRTTSNSGSPVFGFLQNKAAVPQGMAAFLRMRRGGLDFKSSRYTNHPPCARMEPTNKRR